MSCLKSQQIKGSWEKEVGSAQLFLPTVLWRFYRWGTWNSVGLSNLPEIWKATKKWHWDLNWNLPHSRQRPCSTMNIISCLSDGSGLHLVWGPPFWTWDCSVQFGSWRCSRRCRGLSVWTDHRRCPHQWFSGFRVCNVPLGDPCWFWLPDPTSEGLSCCEAPWVILMQMVCGAHFDEHYPKRISYVNLVLSLLPSLPSFFSSFLSLSLLLFFFFISFLLPNLSSSLSFCFRALPSFLPSILPSFLSPSLPPSFPPSVPAFIPPSFLFSFLSFEASVDLVPMIWGDYA